MKKQTLKNRVKSVILKWLLPQYAAQNHVFGSQSVSGEYVDTESAKRISAVWACVNMISGMASSLPVHVYKKGENGVSKIIHNHPVERLLTTSANKILTGADLRKSVFANTELQGSGFAYKVKNAAGKTLALEALDQSPVFVERHNGDLKYKFVLKGRQYEVYSDDVFHNRGFNPTDLGGDSTIKYATDTFGLAQAAEKSASGIFKNGLQSPGFFSFKDWLDGDQVDIIQKEVDEKYTGAENAGKPLVLPGGAEYRPYSLKPDDAQMLQTRQLSTEDVARFFLMPPFLIGANSKDNNYPSEVTQILLLFVKTSFSHRVKSFDLSASKQLLTKEERGQGLFIKHNLDGLLAGDPDDRSTYYQKMIASGVMTINEARGLENYAPVEGGEVPRLQMQYQRIDQMDTAPDSKKE